MDTLSRILDSIDDSGKPVARPAPVSAPIVDPKPVPAPIVDQSKLNVVQPSLNDDTLMRMLKDIPDQDEEKKAHEAELKRQEEEKKKHADFLRIVMGIDNDTQPKRISVQELLSMANRDTAINETDQEAKARKETEQKALARRMLLVDQNEQMDADLAEMRKKLSGHHEDDSDSEGHVLRGAQIAEEIDEMKQKIEELSDTVEDIQRVVKKIYKLLKSQVSEKDSA